MELFLSPSWAGMGGSWLPWKRASLVLKTSPGRGRVQKRVVWSLLPETRMWPTGCQSRLQMQLSWAVFSCSTGDSELDGQPESKAGLLEVPE